MTKDELDALEAAEIPMPTPTYENICWNCGAEINNVICQHAGYDDETGEPNGYECNECGMSLYERRRENAKESLQTHLSQC